MNDKKTIIAGGITEKFSQKKISKVRILIVGFISAFLGGYLVYSLLAAVNEGSSSSVASFDPAVCQRPYTASSPWNTPIVNPVYSTNSDAHIAKINEDNKALSSDGTQFTFPVFYVNNETERQTVRFKSWFSDVKSDTVMYNYRWSSSEIAGGGGGYVATEGDTNAPEEYVVSDERGVPIPEGIEVVVEKDEGGGYVYGYDRQVVIINTDTGEVWGMTFYDGIVDGYHTTASLSHYNVTFTGVPPRSSQPPGMSNGMGYENNGPFRQIGAGIPPLSGLIRPCEVIKAVDDPGIDDLGHAIQFAYDWPARTFDSVCNPDSARVEPAQFLSPASNSDGSSCFPDVLEGTRLQLDPSISDDTIKNSWNCKDACFVIAKTLQKYGMYVIDQSGRPKIRPEFELTAKWTELQIKYQVTNKTVNPIPITSFKVVESSDSGPVIEPVSTIPLYHLWSPARTDNLATTSDTIRDRVLTRGDYTGGKIMGYIDAEPGSGKIPLYHLWSPARTDNLATTSDTIRDRVLTRGDYTGGKIMGYIWTERDGK